MLRILLILLVPGIIFLSSLADSNDSSKNAPAPTQVQNIAPKAPSGEGGAAIQKEKQVGTVQNTRPAAAETVKPTTSLSACGTDYYRNVDGNCVHRPSDNPSGASARCRDGSYSYSQNRRGTCSGHGGVSVWY